MKCDFAILPHALTTEQNPGIEKLLIKQIHFHQLTLEYEFVHIREVDDCKLMQKCLNRKPDAMQFEI